MLHPVFDIALICVSLTNSNILWHFLILACFYLHNEKRTDNTHKKSKTVGPYRVLTTLISGLFTFWCLVKKNLFHWSFVLKLSPQNDLLNTCFQSILPFLVTMIHGYFHQCASLRKLCKLLLYFREGMAILLFVMLEMMNNEFLNWWINKWCPVKRNIFCFK